MELGLRGNDEKSFSFDLVDDDSSLWGERELIVRDGQHGGEPALNHDFHLALSASRCGNGDINVGRVTDGIFVIHGAVCFERDEETHHQVNDGHEDDTADYGGGGGLNQGTTVF